MAGFGTDPDRKVIPRLRTFQATGRLGELDPIDKPRLHDPTNDSFLAKKIAAWKRQQTAGHASDLIGTALTVGKLGPEALTAARVLRDGRREISPWTLELANAALGIDRTSPVQSSLVGIEQPLLNTQVRIFRQLLREEPNDPVTWVDLAYAYACLGKEEHSKRSMKVAVQLAPDNRFILRSAGRLWIHFEDPERAHRIVAKSKRTFYDPWLLAAEIAFGSIAGKKQKHIKVARRLILDGRFEERQISELAAALATLELSSGNLKKAKRLFVKSLQDPTENSIAQVSWAARHHIAISVNREYIERPNAFEAQSWTCFQEGKWAGAISNCRDWFSDQPFSSRPAILGSYVASSVLQEHSQAISFTKNALRANPADFPLLNNLAFAQAQSGQMSEARKTLSKVNRAVLERHEAIVLRATEGLLAFRTGNVVKGRELYTEARASSKRLTNPNRKKLYALASIHHALEEQRAGGPECHAICREVSRSVGTVSDPVVRILFDRLNSGEGEKEKASS